MRSNEHVEEEELNCGRCSKPVKTKWVYTNDESHRCLGLERDPSYVLAADVIFHTSCWDELVKEDPP